MLTLLISLAIACTIGYITRVYNLSPVWSAVCFFGGFFLSQLTASLYVRFRVKKVQEHLQNIMLEARRKMEIRQQSLMRRPQGSPQQMMKLLEKDQKEGIEKALAACEEFTPLFKWQLFLSKQINTMKMAFHYQLGHDAETDRLMGKAILLDPQSIAMKLARMYLRKEEGIDRFYRRKRRYLRSDAVVLPALTFAWILVKQGKTEDAVKVLAEAKSRSKNEVLLKNWEALANGKVKQFSNADLADAWYALRLEEYRPPRIQQRVSYARR